MFSTVCRASSKIFRPVSSCSSVITTGGKKEAYAGDGHNRFTIRQLMAPIEQTARLCGIEYLPPFAVHGTHSLQQPEIEVHAREYARFLEALRDNRVDMDAVRRCERVNADLEAIISGTRAD